MIVPISDTEMLLLQNIGTLRHKETSQHGQEAKQSAQNPLQISIDGVIGEYAVAKALNLHFSLDCDYRDFGADLISRKGKKIDVKSTRTVGGNLNAVLWSAKKPVDIFILAEIGLDSVDVIGYIDRESFLIPEHISDVGHGNFYSIPQSKLKPL